MLGLLVCWPGRDQWLSRVVDCFVGRENALISLFTELQLIFSATPHPHPLPVSWEQLLWMSAWLQKAQQSPASGCMTVQRKTISNSGRQNKCMQAIILMVSACCDVFLSFIAVWGWVWLRLGGKQQTNHQKKATLMSLWKWINMCCVDCLMKKYVGQQKYHNKWLIGSSVGRLHYRISSNRVRSSAYWTTSKLNP